MSYRSSVVLSRSRAVFVVAVVLLTAVSERPPARPARSINKDAVERTPSATIYRNVGAEFFAGVAGAGVRVAYDSRQPAYMHQRQQRTNSLPCVLQDYTDGRFIAVQWRTETATGDMAQCYEEVIGAWRCAVTTDRKVYDVGMPCSGCNRKTEAALRPMFERMYV